MPARSSSPITSPGAEPGRGVDQPSARHDLRHGLDAEPPDAGGAGELGDRPAVVAAVADLQVAERVEVGAELLRAGHLLGDPVDAFAPTPPPVGVVRGGDERLAEEAAGEDRDVLVEHAPEVVQPPVRTSAQRLEPLGLVDVVEHPELVVGAERRRPPAGSAGVASLRRPRLAEAREERQAAVDEDRLPGDVGGVVAGEEAVTPAISSAVAGAPHRDVLLDLRALHGVVDPGAVDRGDRRARADPVDADAAAGVLERERAGQVLHPALADASSRGSSASG